MAIFFPVQSISRASNARIEDIYTENNTTFITISYRSCRTCDFQTVMLVANRNTILFNENQNPVPLNTLKKGMTINALFSSAMTRSIPPQATAYLIQIVERPTSDVTTVGRIIDIDRQNNSFTTTNDRNPSSAIRFNLSENARIFDKTGRQIPFGLLMPGMRVRVRHASFMTASIPPQTTAFEVRVL